MLSMFDVSFARLIGNEGGFKKESSDRGDWTSGVIGKGKLVGTKYGLAAMTYPDLDIENLTVDEAKVIYKRDWWDKLGMDQFPPALAFQFFDAAINHGAVRASMFIQMAAGAKPDGNIGPKTIAAVNSADKNDLLMLFLAARLEFFSGLKTWDNYSRGWARRIVTDLRFASQDN